jgi:glycosyltransferase involved in cell wall biosynthesis
LPGRQLSFVSVDKLAAQFEGLDRAASDETARADGSTVEARDLPVDVGVKERAMLQCEDATVADAPRPERRLRVLMVTPRFPPDLGGVERHVWEVARRIAAMGCDVTVLCTDRTGTRVGCEVSDGVRVQRVRAWGARQDHYLAPALWGAMAGDDWDVVHVQSYHTFVAPIAMARAIQRRIPFVLTFHGGGHSSRIRHSLRRTQRKLLGPLIRRAACLVAIARFEITEYGAELHIPPQRFRLIPNGIDLAVDTRGGALDDHRTIVASIGRLERYKGHHRVLAAIPDLLHARPDAQLWIVGTGPQERTLREEAQRLGISDHVEFRSVPSDNPVAMAELLQRTSIVVSMSDFETHPLSALEAAAARRPLVVSDTSGLRELAEQGFARAVPLSIPAKGLSDAILEELENPHSSDPIELMSWDGCAAELLALYWEVACGS